jgi:hypothetical protein
MTIIDLSFRIAITRERSHIRELVDENEVIWTIEGFGKNEKFLQE